MRQTFNCEEKGDEGVKGAVGLGEGKVKREEAWRGSAAASGEAAMYSRIWQCYCERINTQR